LVFFILFGEERSTKTHEGYEQKPTLLRATSWIVFPPAKTDTNLGQYREPPRREDVLPIPMLAGVRVLAGERVRQINVIAAPCQILLVQRCNPIEMSFASKVGSSSDRSVLLRVD
jgi:hypothetical protein